MEPLKTIEIGSITVKILPDDTGHHDCPIEYDNNEKNSVIFATFERRSTLTDHNPFSNPEAAREFAEENGWELFDLRKYEHSGVGYSVANKGYPYNCPWDSGQVGYVLVNPKDFEECKSQGRTAAREIAEGICESVTTWCNGWYYGFVIENEEGDHLDSCWGFDDADYCENEAVEIAKHHAKEADEKAAREREAERPDMYSEER